MSQRVFTIELDRALETRDVLLTVNLRMLQELLDRLDLSRALVRRALEHRPQTVSVEFVPCERFQRLEKHTALDALVTVENRVFLFEVACLQRLGWLGVSNVARVLDPALMRAHVTFHLFAVKEPLLTHWTVN